MAAAFLCGMTGARSAAPAWRRAGGSADETKSSANYSYRYHVIHTPLWRAGTLGGVARVLGRPQLGGVNSRLRLAEAQQWKVLLVTVVPHPSM